MARVPSCSMSSGAGRFPHPHLWAYGVSKAGICFLAETAAEELGPLGIRVNAVAPGIIADELMAFITVGGPLLDDYLAQMPLGRVGTVEDVAAAVRYLIGPESSFVTGETLGVDGGHHLRRGADYSLLFGGWARQRVGAGLPPPRQADPGPARREAGGAEDAHEETHRPVRLVRGGDGGPDGEQGEADREHDGGHGRPTGRGPPPAARSSG